MRRKEIDSGTFGYAKLTPLIITDSIKLMMAFRQWAENRHAREMMIGVTSGENIELTDRMLKKMGARLIGGNYSIVLDGGAAAAMQSEKAESNT